VLITPLLIGGELPTQELLDKILNICDPKDKRPLTDHVTVSAPVVRSFDIGLTYWIDINNSASAVAIQTAVNEAVQAYILWQKSKLGRNINPSELTRLVMQAGAYRVDIINPSYTAIAFNEVAIADQVTVTYGGFTDD
jgi:phage-related baseplate assembly protein